MSGSNSDVLANVLHGRRVRVIEDERMVADEIAPASRNEGAEVIGPSAAVPAGLSLAATYGALDGALLDVDVGSVMSWPLARVLLARGVPIVLATSYDSANVPPEHEHLPRFGKPVAIRDLTRTLASTLSRGTARG